MSPSLSPSLFRCPLCSSPLHRDSRGYRCPKGHCFDVAAAGYTHLLPANKKHSKNPGDDKEMVAARSALLDAGYYAPLLDALCRVVTEYTLEQPECTILDCGCGEGYYTAGIAKSLTQSGHTPRVAGIDISKFALKKAAKRLPAGEFAVASAYHLPLSDSTADVLLNIFSPLSIKEFGRVLKPDGLFLYVVPSALHLWEMKQVLYDVPYENPVKREEYPGFEWLDCHCVRFTAHLNCSEHIMALFGMTPYAWKTPKAGIERLSQLSELDTQIGFDIHIYKKA